MPSFDSTRFQSCWLIIPALSTVCVVVAAEKDDVQAGSDAKKTEFQPGDLRRLISTGGSFTWQAWITIRQAGAGDISMVVGGRPVPREIRTDTED